MSIFYNFLVSIFGLLLGGVIGRYLPDREIYRRMFTQTEWIQELPDDADRVSGYITRCFVMSDLEQQEKSLLYKGVLHRVGLDSMGDISFIVLDNPKNGLFEIGRSGESIEDNFNHLRSEDDYDTRLHIGKNEIKNVVFESEPIL